MLHQYLRLPQKVTELAAKQIKLLQTHFFDGGLQDGIFLFLSRWFAPENLVGDGFEL